jgi:GT2 family glycosyltransferase
LLASLARQTRPAVEIVAVDNGSTDGAGELARSRGARVIAMGRNAGFAAAVNRGIRDCGSRFGAIAVLNSDVELAPDYLERLANADAPFATGKLLAASGDWIDGTFDAMCRGGTSWRVGSGRPDSASFAERRTIASAPLTAALFRTEVFERVGLLEERFESYLEDVDFGLRCAARKIEGIYEPAAVARHQGSATLGRWHADTVRRIARNQILLVARHYPRALMNRWIRPIAAAHLLWGGVALRHGRGWAWLRGIAQGLTDARRVRKDATQIPPEVLEDLLPANERAICQFQASSGYDAYWRWYFRLAGREA